MLRRALLAISLGALAIAGAAAAPLGAGGTAGATTTTVTSSTPTAPAAGRPAVTLLFSGHGWGHGAGMSQWGAKGYAEHGWTYDRILAHYYPGTTLGATDPNRTVRVLIRSTGTASLSGAARAGSRTLNAGKTYRVRRYGASQVALYGPGGKRLGVYAAPLQVASASSGMLRLSGAGSYRGVLEFRPDVFAGVNAINAVPLEDYVAGVVSRESPSSWPIEALKAQAVAARTYAITTSKAGPGFDQYADTRSQVYGGVAAETASSNDAVAATRGQVVTYDGAPVVTYFFSTSGGRTENVENTNLGTEPKPWLKSVNDPYDNVSPRHRWGPIRMSMASAAARLGGLVKGRFKGVRVSRRGVSPRIVTAKVIGTGGSTTVSGATLRARLGLDDTWAYFTSISTRKKKPPAGDPSSGGTTPPKAATAGPHARGLLAGSVYPERMGAEVQVQLRTARGWHTVASTIVRRGGRYAAAVARPGTYRTVFSGDAGPSVRVR
jgi:stage II sporulation protein D